ncbi:MAG: TPM domain-containing protein [Gammaproteobacteria bacterium]
MQIGRLIRHVAATQWRTRMMFPNSALDAIEQAIGRVELAHRGEIRFAIETALSPLHVLNNLPPRSRALEVFAHLKVWDTEHNNGVLIYVQMADRDVEIVADRGFEGRVSLPEWEAVCRLMEEHFRAGRFEAGSIAGVEAIGHLLKRHFPAIPSPAGQAHNQLPDRPTLL